MRYKQDIDTILKASKNKPVSNEELEETIISFAFLKESLRKLAQKCNMDKQDTAELNKHFDVAINVLAKEIEKRR